MRGQTIAQACAAVLVSFALAACSGGSIGSGGSGGSSSGGSSSGGSSSGGVKIPVYALGSLNGNTFTPGVIAVGTSPLDPGGSSGLTVAIVDTANSNALYTTPVAVTFSSPCASSGAASISSPVTTINGSATSTYQAKGCSGTETITAMASAGTQSLSASGSITVKPAPPSSIQFTSTTPNSIRIKGTGDPQTAVVVFTVKNTAGGPSAGQSVKFSLDTTIGGITISPATGMTDTNGKVQTIVNAGTVHTSVRVTATVVDGSGAAVGGILPAQSDTLVISTGLARQSSFSISVGCFNIEGGDYDGTQTNVNIFAGDRFDNPVPDGTAISFQSGGGQIQPQCFTTGGNCSVQFSSSNPRTANHRVEVLATAVGEENFVDLNGNGQYDAGEPFSDLPEAWLDVNENGVRDPDEPFLDFNNNGKYDGPTGLFKGVLCKSGCDAATSLHVRALVPIIMSGSTANVAINPSPIDLSNGAVAVQVTVGDSANQPMPAKTTIAASTTFGSIIGDSSVTQGCSTFNGPFVYTFIVQPPAGQASNASGIFLIKVTTPKGTITTVGANVVFNVPTPPPPVPGKLQNIQFGSAKPTTIGIKGTGTPGTSTVSFQVFDDKGNPLANQTVGFSLSTTAGGLTLTPSSAVSDSNGMVQAMVNAGSVHTSVRVKATATQGSTTVFALSSVLTVSTGIPASNSFSLSASTLNIEGAGIDGVQSKVNVLLADRYSNPAPDGTAVSFTSQGGQIQPSCTTTGGGCTVTFTTANPRTANHRYAILAYAIGEESFTDTNGNGYYDSGESFADLPEAFRDDNETGKYASPGLFIDFNGNQKYDGPPGTFTGVLCNSGCNPNANSLNIFGNMTLVMSSSAAKIAISPSAITVAPNGAAFVTVNVQDTAGQAMAKGTAIAATSTYGTASAGYTQADTTASGGTQNYGFTVSDSTGKPGSGFFTVTVTTPSGAQSSATVKVN